MTSASRPLTLRFDLNTVISLRSPRREKKPIKGRLTGKLFSTIDRSGSYCQSRRAPKKLRSTTAETKSVLDGSHRLKLG
ncbi:hypothetical protein J5N97_011567 [Dioscorea zingiberensis]|uniref:Uncharacterized protein n=1 Tax=Dioscorea zingiberensis TaxID=325984 RepID=A0A9D5HPP6_9LILI|nr:hypothetical protein J5N97_011567 [Dioscorea zingiberensis]